MEEQNLDLDWSLSNADIDEILGREHTEVEGLTDSYIDEAVDEFVENNDNIPSKRKGLFSEIFKKDIKKRKCLSSQPEEEIEDNSSYYIDMLLSGEEIISPSEFNDIMSDVFPDTYIDEEQVRMTESYLKEYGIMLEEQENAENGRFLHENTSEGPDSAIYRQDDTIIERHPENLEMGQIQGAFFSGSEKTEDLDEFFKSETVSDAPQPSFLPEDEQTDNITHTDDQAQEITTGSKKLSFEDIEMVFPSEESRISTVERDSSYFNSITDPQVNNTTLDNNKENDTTNKKIFDQISAVSQTGSEEIPYPMTFYDPEIRKYYIPESGPSVLSKDMETILNGQRVSTSQKEDHNEPLEESTTEEGIYEKHGDSFRVVDFSSAAVDKTYGENTPIDKAVSGNAPGQSTTESQREREYSQIRYTTNVASFRVNHGYEEYSETIGRLVSDNINNTTTDIESEVTKGARDFRNSETVWWIRTLLAPVGASSVRDSINAEGRICIDAASQFEKYVASGKLSINDLNIGGSEACERIRENRETLVSEQAMLKTELGKKTVLLQAEKDEKQAEMLRTEIDVIKARISNKEDEIERNERSIKEQIKLDYNELKDKLGIIEKEKKSLNTEISTLTKDIRKIEKRLGSGDITPEKRVLLQKKLEISRNTLAERQSLAETLGARTPVRNRDILKRHKELYAKFTTREAMMNCKSFSDAEKSFVRSRDFFGNGDRKLYGAALQKYLKSKGVSYTRDHDISRLSAKDLEKFIKGGKKNGLSALDIEAVRGLKMRNDRIHWAGKSGGRSALAFKRVADRILRSDGVYGESYNRMRVKVNSAKMATRIAKISSELIRVSWSTSLLNKVNTRIIRNVKVKIKGSYISRTIYRGRMLHNAKKIKQREARRQTYSELKKTLGKPAEFIKQKARDARNSFHNIKAVKGFNNAKDKVRQGFNGVKRSFVNSKPVKKVKNAGRIAKDRLEKTASIGRRIKSFLAAPFKAIAKIKNLWDLIKKKILMLLGHIAILFVKFYIAFVLLVLIVNTIISLLGAVSGYAEDTAKMMKEMQAKLINYPELRYMKEDVDWILDEDAERREEAQRIGEGRPINPYVTCGKTVDRYGSPERWPGYTLHFIDAYGNEMPSDSTNARDIVALATAMMSNEIGNIHGDWRDLHAMDDLIADLYEMLSDRITYEESDIYFCEYGCDYYGYYCNDWEYYRQFNNLISQGAHKYENLEPYNPRGCEFDEEGYENYYAECEEWYYDIKPRRSDYEYFDYGEMEWVFDEDAYEDALDEWYDMDWEPDRDDWYYCHWHYVPICYGHKDIDIYITLYDLNYAIENRMYPQNWESKSYADQIRSFMNKGGWDNEEAVTWAHNYYDGDWYKIYGIDVEKGCGFSKGRPLSDSEIEEILERIGDISEARRELIEFALNAVGKIGYQYGGKASGSGMGARFGSSTPDEKGRTNGLDCSGFVQWVYRSALGMSVPGSTAGYSGYPRISKSSLKIGDIGFYEVPGSEDNHMGIYLGVDESGNETWVHCSGASGATYGTGNFRYFVSLF